MPASFELDYSRRLLRIRGRDLVTAGQLYAIANEIRQLFADGTIDASWSELVDFREVTRTEHVPTVAVRELAHDSPWPHTARRAIVAPAAAVFGMSRMYQLLSTSADEVMAVVRSEEEALEFLADA